MANDLLLLAVLCWLAAAALGLAGAQICLARALLGLGGVAALAAALVALPAGTLAVSTPFGIDGLGSSFFSPRARFG